MFRFGESPHWLNSQNQRLFFFLFPLYCRLPALCRPKLLDNLEELHQHPLLHDADLAGAEHVGAGMERKTIKKRQNKKKSFKKRSLVAKTKDQQIRSKQNK
jgi:hypothetical protein